MENKFDHFLHFLLDRLKHKYAKSIGHSISQQIKLEAYSDCALVYNPLGSAKHPKLILHIPSLYESGCDSNGEVASMVCSAIWFSSLVGEMPNRSFSSFTSAARTSF